MTHIAVIYSLPTKRALQTPFVATDEDTKDSALKVTEALHQRGAQVSLIEVSENEIETIKDIKADCIFNLIEWTGLDLNLAYRAFKLIELSGMPFTGATSHNYELTCDKQKMKKALNETGLPTARWQLFETGNEPIRSDFKYPVLVKLAWEHCSIGLTADAVVATREQLAPVIKNQLAAFAQPVFVEEFLDGREFQVTLLETKEGLKILPPAEISYPKSDAWPFLTYAGRWQEDHPDYKISKLVVPQLEKFLENKIKDISRQCFMKLKFRDYARFDLRGRGDDLFILEPNANPGLDDCDDYSLTASYKAAGMTFADFIWEIVSSALRRFSSYLPGQKNFGG